MILAFFHIFIYIFLPCFFCLFVFVHAFVGIAVIAVGVGVGVLVVMNVVDDDRNSCYFFVSWCCSPQNKLQYL